MVVGEQGERRTGPGSHLQQLGTSLVSTHVDDHRQDTMLSQRLRQELGAKPAGPLLLRRRRSHGDVAWNVSKRRQKQEPEGSMAAVERMPIELR